jgi:hypothetical protein
MTYAQSFKGKPADMQRYALRGPDVTEHVAFEPDGLRIRLPPGYPAQRPSVGLFFNSTVQGNFEITARFELLKEPSPEDAGNNATRVTLGILLDTPERNEAAVSRRMIAKGATQFFSFLIMDTEAKGKAQPKLDTVPTNARTGRLRLARIDSTLYCYASEGADEEFILVKSQPFRAHPGKQVFLHASTGGPRADLDVRISDFRVVADALPELAATEAPPVGTGRWLIAAVVVNTLLLLAALGGWITLRHIRRAEKDRPK